MYGLFKKCGNYTEISFLNFLQESLKKQPICQASITNINAYLKTKNFIGTLVAERSKILILNKDCKLIKIFSKRDLVNMLDYLSYKANPIQRKGEGYGKIY